MVKHIKAQELKGLLKKGAILVDVREQEEVNNDLIEGSLHWPLSRLNANRSEMSKNRPTIFCCTSGLRSQKAAEIAQEWTDQETYTLDGSVTDYLIADLSA